MSRILLGALASILATDALAVREPSTALVCHGYDDDVGALEIGDYLGARRRAKKRQMARPRNIPGIPAFGKRLQPLGLGSSAFTATSGTLLQLQASPQKPFKGKRLIIDLTRTGVSATGLVTIAQFAVGVQPQSPGIGGVSVSTFGATSVDTNIEIDECIPGVNITLQFNVSAAPTVADRIDFGGSLIGTTFSG